MLLVLFGVSAVFFIEPIVQDYPADARVFPQLTSAVVLIGSFLLLIQNYLPDPIQTFVAESVTITAGDEELIGEEEEEEIEEEVERKPTLGREYGYDVNDTTFMLVTATLYFFLGWGAGFLFVTPLFVLFYTTWFRVPWPVGLGLAALATVVIYAFIAFLFLPFERGAIFDFSPFLPIVADVAGIALERAMGISPGEVL